MLAGELALAGVNVGKPPRYLPCRAAPGRCHGVAQHYGASGAVPAPSAVLIGYVA